MEVVLRQDVEKLGLRGEVVSVARGYARNYLLPRGLAEPATAGLVRELARRDADRAKHEAKSADEAKAIAAKLQSLELRIDANAGPTGSLFGSVTATNIADRLWEQEKIRIDRRKLALDPIKRIGRYVVPVELFADVTAELRVAVAPEGEELPPEADLEAQVAAEAEAEAAEAAAVEAEHAQAAAAIEAAEATGGADEGEVGSAGAAGSQVGAAGGEAGAAAAEAGGGTADPDAVGAAGAGTADPDAAGAADHDTGPAAEGDRQPPGSPGTEAADE
jgi:large subunit ribosomal protein L9